jgi:hypothetical protein
VPHRSRASYRHSALALAGAGHAIQCPCRSIDSQPRPGSSLPSSPIGCQVLPNHLEGSCATGSGEGGPATDVGFPPVAARVSGAGGAGRGSSRAASVKRASHARRRVRTPSPVPCVGLPTARQARAVCSHLLSQALCQAGTRAKSPPGHGPSPPEIDASSAGGSGHWPLRTSGEPRARRPGQVPRRTAARFPAREILCWVLIPMSLSGVHSATSAGADPSVAFRTPAVADVSFQRSCKRSCLLPGRRGLPTGAASQAIWQVDTQQGMCHAAERPTSPLGGAGRGL